jgi:penicillin-binding protein 1C
VWVGNADGEGRPELTGTAAAAPLLFSIFNSLPKKEWFKKPVQDLESVSVCAHSGFKASAICENVVRKEYPKGASKTLPCPFHQLVHLDERENYQVNSNCYPVDKMKHRSWFVATPAQEYFFKQKSSFYRSLPPFLADCGGDNNIHHLEILYPKAGFKIYVPVDQSGRKSSCVLKATHKNKNATLFWHLDNEYIGTTNKFHELAVTPPKGRHALQVTDNAGETSVCSFEVVDR